MRFLLSSITIPSNCTTIARGVLSEIIMNPVIAPSVEKDTFCYTNVYSSHEGFVGENTKNDGVNTLRIHKDSTGYYDGAWMTSLVKECGFHIEYLD